LGPFLPPTAHSVINTDVRLLLDFQKKGLTIPAFLAAGPRSQLRHGPNQISAAIVVADGMVPGINSLINSIVERHSVYSNSSNEHGKIYGVRNGFEGLCNFWDNVVALDSNITWKWLDKGGSMLGVEQYYANTEQLDKTILSDSLQNNRIDILYIIGGNESLKVAHQLAQMNPTRSIVGIPATIDDDIPWIETPVGFSTVVEQAAHVINTLHTAAESTRRICLIELAGTKSNLVTISAVVGASSDAYDTVLLPEDFDLLKPDKARTLIDKAVRYIESRVQARPDNPHAVVIVAEGVGKALEMRGVSIDESGEPNESFIDQFSRILARQVHDAHGHPMSVFVNQPRNNILSVPPNIRDRIHCKLLGKCAVDSAMAGYTDFMITEWQADYVLVPLSLVVEKTTLDFVQKDHPKPESRLDAELLDSDTLRIRIPMPALLNIEDLTRNIDEKLNAVEILYSLFAILESESKAAIESFLVRLREPDTLVKARAISLHQFLAIANEEPLHVVAIHYGSPVSIDLLGIGKVLEVIRDIIKDMAWRGKYEKELAEVERKGKQAEIVTARLEHEKTSVEIAAQRIQLDKIRLENEKLQLEMVVQKLEIMQKAMELPLTDDDKKSILAVVTSQIATISRTLVLAY
jgi:6-phosphofructokinase 1